MNDTKKAYLFEGENDAQVFRHYLELCSNDPERAFKAYKENYFDPVIKDLSERLAEAEAKLKRNSKDDADVTVEVEHLIAFMTSLGINEEPTYEAYQDYCHKTKYNKPFRRSKFYKELPRAINKILITEISKRLPKTFSKHQALDICNEWQVKESFLTDLLQNEKLFIQIPLDAEEKKALNLKGEVYQRCL